MSLFLVVALAWLTLVVLGWSWLASAGRADRDAARRSARSHPRA
jgi:hypothetical protein